MLRRTLLAVGALIAMPMAAQAEDFKIGMVMSLTGANSEVGNAYVMSANAGIALVNQRGGIGGMQAKLLVCDSRSVEQEAVICARRLALQDKVNLLLGTGSSPATIAVLPTVEQAGVPLFVFAAATNIYTPVKKWVFKGIPTSDDQLPTVMDFLKGKKWTKAAMIRDNGPYGADTANAVKMYAAKAGIEIIADEVYSPSDTDMTAQVTRIRGLKPDAILNMAIIPPAGAIVTRTVAQLGMDTPVFVGLNMQSDGFVQLVGEASKLLYFVGSKVVLAETSANDPLRDNIAAFRKAYMETNPGQKLTSLSPAAVDGMLLAQAAVKNLGSKALDANALLAALDGLKSEKGLQGVWTLSPTDHASDLRAGMTLVRNEGGSWVAAR